MVIDPNQVPPVELQFLKDIIDFMYKQKDKYQVLIKEFYGFDADDDTQEKIDYV